MLATAGPRTMINYEGKRLPVINLCSYNYLGLANHPEVVAAAQEALEEIRRRRLWLAHSFRNDRSASGAGAERRRISRS